MFFHAGVSYENFNEDDDLVIQNVEIHLRDYLVVCGFHHDSVDDYYNISTNCGFPDPNPE